MSRNKILSVKPIINYPSVARIGQTYLMTVDLQSEEDSSWQLKEEEYPVYCSVKSEAFESKAIGEPIVTLHRFGGSYGAVSFLIKAGTAKQEESLVVLFRNKWGSLIQSVEIENIRVLTEGDTQGTTTPLIKDEISADRNRNTQRDFLQNISDSLEHSPKSKYIADIFIKSGLYGTTVVQEWMQNTYLPANLSVEWTARLNQICTQAYTASQRYIESCISRYGSTKILGMKYALDLESIYTEVYTFENPSNNVQSVDNLENSYRNLSQRLQIQNSRAESGIKVVNKNRFLTILGGAGSGKTTFLRKILLTILNGKDGSYAHERIPILIELKTLGEASNNLIDDLALSLDLSGFPMVKNALSKLLEQGKLAILLDGLDEINLSHRSTTMTRLNDFIDKYDKNQFLITCRPAAYKSYFKRFKDVVITDFGDAQIEHFIDNWFTRRNETGEFGENLWKLLQLPENSGIKELTHTPIFLVFICLVYDRSGSLPGSRSHLFQKATRILLEEWSAEKRVEKTSIFEGLDIELESALLSEIAYTSFLDDQFLLRKEKLLGKIRDFLRKTLNAPNSIDAEAVLDAIDVQQGIFVQQNINTYSFSHLALQEYFTAQYITDNSLQESIVEKYLSDRRWQDVFPLISGLLTGSSNCDGFLLAIDRNLKKYITSSKLNALLHWAKTTTSGARSRYKPSLRRSIAIFVFLSLQYVHNMNSTNKENLDFSVIQRFHGLAVELTSESSSPLSESYHSLEKLNQNNSFEFLLVLAQTVQDMSVFGSNNDTTALLHALDNLSLNHRASEASEQSGPLIEQAIKVWHNIFSFEQNLLVLSEEEQTTLSNYAYGTSLLLKVQKAAVKVSRSTWNQIEQRMLTSDLNQSIH